MPKKKIIVLGGGLAGLSAAWFLQQRGKECVVLEKEKQAGGLCRSKKVKGFTFDHDGHLLHFRDRYTLGLVKRLLPGNLARHKRNAWVHSCGNSIPYPFQANLHALPPRVGKECLDGFIRCRKSREAARNENFLKWINSYFGKGIAKYFMLPYNRKFWAVPLGEMTCAWLRNFMPKPGFAQVVKGYYAQNKEALGYNASFYYPKRGGIEELPLALESRIRYIHKDSCVSSIDLKKKELVIAGASREKFDVLVLTIPLPELGAMIKDLPENISQALKSLRWNSIFNLNLGLDQAPGEKRHWIYFPQKEISFFRIGFYHNFSKEMAPERQSSLYAEVSYSMEEPLEKKNIVSRIIGDLKKSGIVQQGRRIVACDINDIKYGYPIYDHNYRRAREKIIKFLLGNDIVPCGRYGSWRYMSMEDVILDAKKTAGRIRA